MIQPGTVAAIAASLMGQGENLSEASEIFTDRWTDHKKRRVKQFVSLALDLCEEAETQTKQRQSKKG